MRSNPWQHHPRERCAVRARQRDRALVARRRSGVTTLARTANWWKFLVVGAGVLGAVIVAVNIIGEVDDTLWLPMMIIMVGSLVTLVAGLILGIAHLTARRPPNAPS